MQFRRPERLVGAVRSALARSGLAPARLELEITESVLMQDAEAAIACLLRLRGMGVRIALDDFGTGYSSLAYLRRFPFSTIKLDRLFTSDIADPWTASLVRALADLATRVEADVTAEGVETAEEFDGMRAAGCRRFQGFLLGRPMSPERASDLAGVAPVDAVRATSVSALAVA